LRAGFLIVDGVFNTELVAPYDLFQHTIFHTKPKPGIEVFTVSPEGQSIKTFEGIEIKPNYSFETAPELDILIVPSADGSMDRDLENTKMIEWVKKTGEKAKFVISLCDGAFVLAKAGLLDGKASTTFPSDLDKYKQMFPHLDVRTGVSYVHDGKVLTSQGGIKSFEVAMYLIDHLYGPAIAKKVGRGLIIEWP
jgi:transcriptional regulator GlxA family with amidase domain